MLVEIVVWILSRSEYVIIHTHLSLLEIISLCYLPRPAFSSLFYLSSSPSPTSPTYLILESKIQLWQEDVNLKRSTAFALHAVSATNIRSDFHIRKEGSDDSLKIRLWSTPLSIFGKALAVPYVSRVSCSQQGLY